MCIFFILYRYKEISYVYLFLFYIDIERLVMYIIFILYRYREVNRSIVSWVGN